MEAVSWKSVPFAPWAEVSTEGEVRVNGELVCPAFTDGYAIVLLRVCGQLRQFRVNRLVAFVFLGEPPEGKPMAIHGDGNPSNNRLENIRWGSAADNSADAIRHGTIRGRYRQVREMARSTELKAGD
jgi:hypothetical protein